jgi:hypothetical protein
MAVADKHAMTATGESSISRVTPLSVGRRLRVLRSLHARLIRFPEQDEVLRTLLARRPALFAEGTVIEPASREMVAHDLLDLGAAGTGRGERAAVLARDLAEARQRIAELRTAVASNREIGVAIGVLMSGCKITEVRAFDLLRVTSQAGNRKLREIAAAVVATGILPKE